MVTVFCHDFENRCGLFVSGCLRFLLPNRLQFIHRDGFSIDGDGFAYRPNCKRKIRHILLVGQYGHRGKNLRGEAKGLGLTLTKKAPYVSLISDVTMFRQIAQNLLSNAIKFTDHGAIEMTVTEANGDFILEVKDTGIGIDPQYHELIFDKFFRVPSDDHHNIKGYGLGLNYVQEVIHIHRGSIGVVSKEGRGSTFTIKLPGYEQN